MNRPAGQPILKYPGINRYFIISILILLVIGVVSAANTDLKSSGKTSTDKTSIDLADGEMTFTDLTSGMSVNTKLKIDKETVKPEKTEKLLENVSFSYIKPANKGKKSNPDAVFTYTYTENQIKETIVLQQDMDLSFPLTIPAGQKFISWYQGTWKIVSATNRNTMVGIVAEKPYGIDAAGRYIDMYYTWDGSELSLNYNRTIPVLNRELSVSGPVFDYYPITYPMTIDPTWTQVGDHWVAYILNSSGVNFTVIKWNTTGTTDWDFTTTGNTRLEFLVVGGGGSGGVLYSGGGGAGGMINNSILYDGGYTYNFDITVGAGGNITDNGEDSILSDAGVAIGGGNGAYYSYAGPTCYPPTNGGSGGGGGNGQCYNGAGSTLNSTQGYNGGAGIRYGGFWAGSGGGGGGAGGVGEIGYNPGSPAEAGAGGIGRLNNITGTLTYYSCGGGGGGNNDYPQHAHGGCPEAGGRINDMGDVHTAHNELGHGGAGIDTGPSGTTYYGGSGVVIVRYPTPVRTNASFTVVNYNETAPDRVGFIDTSTNNPTIWNWSYRNVTGDNITVWFNTSQNPIIEFGPGNFTIKLNATNAGGSNLSKQTTYINVTGPKARFNASANLTISGWSVPTTSTISGIAPLQIEFDPGSSNTSYYSSTTLYNWSYRNVTGNNVTVWFSTTYYPLFDFGPGNFSIKLNVTDEIWSNLSTQTTYVNVSRPRANFTASSYSGIAPLGVQFNSDTSTKSSSGTTLYNWSYRNVTGNNVTVWFNTSQYPVIYFGQGNFSIQLNMSNSLTGLWSNLSTQTTFINISRYYNYTIAGWTADYSTTYLVEFTDASSGDLPPFSWAWFFGDEPYNQTWVLKNASSGWTGRADATSVIMDDGSVVVMGGWDGSSLKNDVWRSTDKGATWLLQNASSGWVARTGLRTATSGGGNIIITGGKNSTVAFNDTWGSNDYGRNWTRLNASSGWSGRYGHTLISNNFGNYILMGGANVANVMKNDTWRSMNGGVTWTQLNQSSGWSTRMWHTSVLMWDNSIVLMGGYNGNYLNDTWRSRDNGTTWQLQNAGSGWTGRYQHISVAMPDASILLVGGMTSTSRNNETWRAPPQNTYYDIAGFGTTWTNKTITPGWTGRSSSTAVGLPDGSILLMGGSDGSYKNDTWQFSPQGSNSQSPSHTYVTGSYTAWLQTSNEAGLSRYGSNIPINLGVEPTPTTLPPGQLRFDGYVKDAETTNMITTATITVSQVLSSTVNTNSEGYYITTTASLYPSQVTTINVTATGYEPYQHVFTPTYADTIRINLTILNLTPDYSGAALGGIARSPPYNRTLDGVTINIVNDTTHYIVTTNSAGYYIKNDITPANYWYDIWGNKTGYANSTTYVRLIGGA